MSYYIQMGDMFDIPEHELYQHVAMVLGTDEMATLLDLCAARNEMTR